jgi:hypothetical protein
LYLILFVLRLFNDESNGVTFSFWSSKSAAAPSITDVQKYTRLVTDSSGSVRGLRPVSILLLYN